MSEKAIVLGLKSVVNATQIALDSPSSDKNLKRSEYLFIYQWY